MKIYFKLIAVEFSQLDADLKATQQKKFIKKLHDNNNVVDAYGRQLVFVLKIFKKI